MSIALLAALAVAAGPESWSTTGKLSTVRLIEVARITGGEARALRPPAKDGLRFVLLVTRTPGVPGLFTLAEPRKFEVLGALYPPQEQGRSEPETTIHDLPRFRTEVRPDIAALRTVDRPEETTVLSVVIGGDVLRAGVAGRIRFEVGWGERTEEFWFTFAVPDGRTTAEGGAPSGAAAQQSVEADEVPEGVEALRAPRPRMDLAA